MTVPQEFDVFGCPLDGTRLIEASAGTGKTWNLCGLYLRLLLETRLEVQQILVVTFTNAATAELHERIRARIAEMLGHLRGQPAGGRDPFVAQLVQQLRARGLADIDMQLQLDQALQRFDEASIFTIHGFCQRALADTPFSAQMPFTVELLQDDAELRAEVVNDFWRRHMAGESLDPLLVAYLVQRNDRPPRLDRLLRRHLAKPLALCVWPATIEEPGSVDEAALQQALASARRLWSTQRESIVQTVLSGLSQLNGSVYKADGVSAAAEQWDHWLASADIATLLGSRDKRLDLLGRDRLVDKTKQKCVTPVHAFFAVAQGLLDAVAAASDTLALQRLQLLRELIDDGSRTLREAKRRRRVIAFDDMLFNLHQRLRGPGGTLLAQALRQRFPAALIDEFQDTDPLQFGTFDALYGGRDLPLFLLGDPKQAIYSFRNADLQTYLLARGQARAEYTLLGNQRSAEPLLRALNALFSVHTQAFMQPGLAFHPAQMGAKPRPAFVDRSEPRAALQLWRLPYHDEDGQLLLWPRARQAAVDATAAEIARLLAASRRGEVMHDGRALAAGDIAVLVRSHRHGSLVRRALAALAVGSVELSQASVFHSPDAEDLERLLGAIAEPGRERLLKAALATEAMGWDATQVDSLVHDEVRWLDCVERFMRYRETWLQQGVAAMLRRWLHGEGVAERLLRRDDGPRRLTNLLHLGEALHEASREHPSPESLLHWLQSRRQPGPGDDSAQLRLESDQDLVQIVTVHKSKGLEYPIVFCPLLWDAPARPRSDLDGVELHDAEGRSIVDFRAGLDAAFDGAAVDAQRRLEDDAESLRLIYVALTRAVQRCLLVVGCPPRQHGAHTSRKAGTHNLLNWLVAGGGLLPREWQARPLKPEAVEAAWQDLATRHAPQIGLATLPFARGTALVAEATAAEALSARRPPAVPPAWRIGSYSSLAWGALHERSALDHDQRAAASAVEAAGGTADTIEAPIDSDDILHFPRGPAAGECLHTLFERADFNQPGGWPAAAAAALHSHRAALPADDGSAALRPRMLQRLLADVLATPLPVGTTTPLRLQDLPLARRLVELEFHLPARDLDAGALDRLLRSLGLAMPTLSFRPLRGYLKGFIDLVLEHDGRWFVLDWKSNHLGDRAADYGQAPVAAAMAAQGYHLQALLYALALDRLLRSRLPDYQHDVHFGGVIYLFVRGVRPPWRDASGRPCGLSFQRPSEAALQRLSALLDGVEVTS